MEDKELKVETEVECDGDCKVETEVELECDGECINCKYATPLDILDEIFIDDNLSHTCHSRETIKEAIADIIKVLREKEISIDLFDEMVNDIRDYMISKAVLPKE